MILRRMVRSLDALLRRYQHIYEFSQDETCLLRLAIRLCDHDLTLSDGTRIARGEPIGELHLWNEHIPLIPKSGPDLAWGLALQRRLARSWAELAAYVEVAPDFQNLRAFRGEMVFGSIEDLAQAITLGQRWGFEFVKSEMPSGVLEQPVGPWRRFATFWRNLYALALIWAFNPVSLRGKALGRLQRGQFWISRATLIRKHRLK